MLCSIKENISSAFQYEKTPKVLYITKNDAHLTKMPCAMHMHEEHLEIVFITDGKGIHTIGGKQYETKKGDIVIYNSRVLHDERASLDSKKSLYCCAVTNLKLEGLRENCLLPDGANPVLHSGDFAEDIESIFRIMQSQLYSQNIGAESICHNMLNSLISIILNQLDKSEDQLKTSERFIGSRIKKYIDDHYLEDLTLEGISNKLYISSSHLCKAFKKSTGYTPMQYITNRRIGKAQSLLVISNYSITDIAFMVGYNDSNYFSTIFTKNVGMSPLKYRKCWVY